MIALGNPGSLALAFKITCNPVGDGSISIMLFGRMLGRALSVSAEQAMRPSAMAVEVET